VTVADLSPEERKAKVAALAETISASRDCDVVIFNYSMDAGIHYRFHDFIKKRQALKKNLMLLVTTEGGDPDSTYRIARCLQTKYDKITIVVAGWCKSAGTLLCIAGNHLVVADSGEMGPLDIQIAKSDELGERSSGLTVEAAFEKLQEQSFELFIRNLSDIKNKIGGRITFKTAADIASQMVIGQTSDIFSKFDPVTIGEDHRANLVAEEYAMRLNLKAKNLRTDRRPNGLEMLLRGYPSHGFVIDRDEAKRLFRDVQEPSGQISELLDLLGMDVVLPRSAANSHPMQLEFLNAEKPARSPKAASRRRARGKSAPAAGNPPDVRRNLPPGPKQEPGAKEAA
jgi:hypothetical protein